MERSSGFTLIELLIACVVVGILAMIALPSYTSYITRGKISEATAGLSDMRVKLEQFFQDNRTYVGACASGTTAPLPTGENAKYFAYTCPTLTATAFVIRATGRADRGMDGFVYEIDQLNARSTSVTAASAAANAGWTGNTSCWVVRKGGQC